MITGKPSATAAHVECGMINAGGSIHNADRGHYPVLMMSGYPPSAESGSVPGARDAGIQWYQQIRDQGELVRQYMRWDHKLASYDNPGTVDHPRRAGHAQRAAGPGLPGHPARGGDAPDGRRDASRCSSQLPPARKPVADRALLRQAAAVAARGRAAGHLRLARRARPAAVPALVELAETARRQRSWPTATASTSRPIIRWRCQGGAFSAPPPGHRLLPDPGHARAVADAPVSARARTCASSPWRSIRSIA